jgi:hypothetical protein
LTVEYLSESCVDGLNESVYAVSLQLRAAARQVSGSVCHCVPHVRV